MHTVSNARGQELGEERQDRLNHAPLAVTEGQRDGRNIQKGRVTAVTLGKIIVVSGGGSLCRILLQFRTSAGPLWTLTVEQQFSRILTGIVKITKYWSIAT